jgi:hypothetical protein
MQAFQHFYIVVDQLPTESWRSSSLFNIVLGSVLAAGFAFFLHIAQRGFEAKNLKEEQIDKVTIKQRQEPFLNGSFFVGVRWKKSR